MPGSRRRRPNLAAAALLTILLCSCAFAFSAEDALAEEYKAHTWEDVDVAAVAPGFGYAGQSTAVTVTTATTVSRSPNIVCAVDTGEQDQLYVHAEFVTPTTLSCVLPPLEPGVLRVGVQLDKLADPGRTEPVTLVEAPLIAGIQPSKAYAGAPTSIISVHGERFIGGGKWSCRWARKHATRARLVSSTQIQCPTPAVLSAPQLVSLEVLHNAEPLEAMGAPAANLELRLLDRFAMPNATSAATATSSTATASNSIVNGGGSGSGGSAGTTAAAVAGVSPTTGEHDRSTAIVVQGYGFHEYFHKGTEGRLSCVLQGHAAGMVMAPARLLSTTSAACILPPTPPGPVSVTLGPTNTSATVEMMPTAASFTFKQAPLLASIAPRVLLTERVGALGLATPAAGGVTFIGTGFAVGGNWRCELAPGRITVGTGLSSTAVLCPVPRVGAARLTNATLWHGHRRVALAAGATDAMIFTDTLRLEAALNGEGNASHPVGVGERLVLVGAGWPAMALQTHSEADTMLQCSVPELGVTAPVLSLNATAAVCVVPPAPGSERRVWQTSARLQLLAAGQVVAESNAVTARLDTGRSKGDEVSTGEKVQADIAALQATADTGNATASATAPAASASAASAIDPAAKPQVLAVEPTRGYTGQATRVLVRGTGFQPSLWMACLATVADGGPGQLLRARFVSSTTVACTLPPAAPGPVTVTIAPTGNASELASGTATFTVGILPWLSAVEPASLPVERAAKVIISGSNILPSGDWLCDLAGVRVAGVVEEVAGEVDAGTGRPAHAVRCVLPPQTTPGRVRLRLLHDGADVQPGAPEQEHLWVAFTSPVQLTRVLEPSSLLAAGSRLLLQGSGWSTEGSSATCDFGRTLGTTPAAVLDAERVTCLAPIPVGATRNATLIASVGVVVNGAASLQRLPLLLASLPAPQPPSSVSEQVAADAAALQAASSGPSTIKPLPPAVTIDADGTVAASGMSVAQVAPALGYLNRTARLVLTGTGMVSSPGLACLFRHESSGALLASSPARLITVTQAVCDLPPLVLGGGAVGSLQVTVALSLDGTEAALSPSAATLQLFPLPTITSTEPKVLSTSGGDKLLVHGDGFLAAGEWICELDGAQTRATAESSSLLSCTTPSAPMPRVARLKLLHNGQYLRPDAGAADWLLVNMVDPRVALAAAGTA